MRFKIITWNVAEEGPPDDLRKLLGFDNKVEPDVYVIGLQELKSTTGVMLSDAISNDSWTNTITAHLQPRNFVRIRTTRMIGVHLSVYIKKDHLTYTSNVASSFTRTGLGGLYGNKGAVSIRMKLYGVSICFVNCHFTAHMPNYRERIQDYADVVESQIFNNGLYILDHDYVFWLGDLNFRIENFTKSEIEAKVQDREFFTLQKTDQLTTAMEKELLLLDFVEAPINFPPTYKYDIGTDKYDCSKKQRKPAWCDRILYLAHEDAFEGIELGVQQLSYSCMIEYRNSDHKPVLADYLIKVLDYPEVLPVLFEPIDQWYCAQDAKSTYTVSTSLPVSTWDWIGLYKADFAHPYDYVTYVWAPPSGDLMKEGDCRLCYFKFDKRYLADLVGDFYLGYYSSVKDCLVGFSDLFPITLTGDCTDSSSDDELT